MPSSRRAATLCICLASLSHAALAATNVNQALPGPNGEQQLGSLNHVGMARSGRYVLMPDPVRAFSSSGPGLYVRDIATRTTQRLAVDGGSDVGYAISANGRYVAFWSASLGRKVVLDRSTSTQTPLAARSGEDNIGLSDDGQVLFSRRASDGSVSLILYRLDTQSETLLAGSDASLGSLYQRNPLSADGGTAIFQQKGVYRLYRADLGGSTVFAPMWAGQALTVSDMALSSSGRQLVFVSSTPGHTQYVYRATLGAQGAYTLSRFDVSAHKVSITSGGLASGLSTSADARYISFHGALETGHPERAAAEAIGSPTYTRLLRLDTRLNQLRTMTTGFNGSTISGSIGTPLINTTSVLSDDGSMLEFATNARNVTATLLGFIGGEQNYHVYADTGVPRNFQFIDLPSTQGGWTEFNPMRLIGPHMWEGEIKVNTSSDAFRFSARGQRLAAGDFDTTQRWYGAGSNPGQATQDGGLLQPSNFSAQFAGTWRVVFNDQTLKYTLSKPDWRRTVIFVQGTTQPGQDMFVRGGIDHGYAQGLGWNCSDSNNLCAIPMRYRNTLNLYTAPWKVNDTHLDWYGAEVGQTQTHTAGQAQGSVMDWTSNNPAYGQRVDVHGYGYTPLNTWGEHYWMLDVEMDCSRTVNGWFEVKSFISGGPGWEPDIRQVGAPWVSGNHFAQCGKLNRFQRGNNSALILPLP